MSVNEISASISFHVSAKLLKTAENLEAKDESTTKPKDGEIPQGGSRGGY